ncbi:hypothetical protein DID73_00310 [Candidatus Marinamargulisbacteria bacterium SCGC AG-343-K17]|nr:hypothetical protein DID73_00310 [Candidatus Marinamargulisbacteria bacterium SCGC AG-343-K17]
MACISRFYPFFCSILLLCSISIKGSQFSIDTGLLDSANSNRAIAQFNLDVMGATNDILRWTHKSSQMSRLVTKGYFIANIFLPYHIGSLVNLAYHEFGHGGRADALGYNHYYQLAFSFDDDQHSAKLHTYYDLFFAIMMNPFIEGASASYYGEMYDHISSDEQAFFSALISANGVNNEMFLASRLSDQNYDRGRGTIFDFLTYHQSKLAVYGYARSEEKGVFGDSGLGDLSYVQSYYEDQHKLSVSMSDFKSYNLVAYFFSAQTWAYFNAIPDYIYRDEFNFSMAPFNGWRLPEVDFYLNPQGPSYLVRSQYEWSSSLSIPFAIEYVFLGDQVLEYTVGVRSNWSSFLSTYTECRLGQQVGFSQTVSMALTDRWITGIGWIHYSGKNLYGARHIPSFERSDWRADDFFISTTYLL